MNRTTSVFLSGCLLLIIGSALAHAESLRDPMLPDLPGKQLSASGEAKLELTATLVGSTRAVAVINGRQFFQGDRIAGHRIHQILPGQVVLQKDRRLTTLAVAKRHIKSPVNQISELQ